MVRELFLNHWSLLGHSVHDTISVSSQNANLESSPIEFYIAPVGPLQIRCYSTKT